MRIAHASLIVLLALPAGFAAARPQAQEQQPSSPAEAARRAREKAASQPKAARAWDNDTVPRTPTEVNVVGTPAAAAPASANAAASSAQNSAAAPAAPQTQAAAPAPPASGAAKEVNDKAATQPELESAKERLKTLTAELEALSRQFTLDQRLYYGKPNYASDREGQQKLDQEHNQVELKRQEVAEAQQKVNELQASLGPPAASAPNPN